MQRDAINSKNVYGVTQKKQKRCTTIKMEKNGSSLRRFVYVTRTVAALLEWKKNGNDLTPGIRAHFGVGDVVSRKHEAKKDHQKDGLMQNWYLNWLERKLVASSWRLAYKPFYNASPGRARLLKVRQAYAYTTVVGYTWFVNVFPLEVDSVGQDVFVDMSLLRY